MPFFSRVRSLWRNMSKREQVEGELHDELDAYVAELTEEKVRAGISPEAARRAALIETGGVEQVKEEVRDARSGALLETTAQDVKYGWRMLMKNPGFTLAAIVALALGIGANTAIFSVVNAVLLRPLPYSEPDRLTVILHRGMNPVAPANYLDWKKQSQSFEKMGAAEVWSPNITGGDRPEQLPALRLSASLFTTLGVQPLLGRTFAEGEDTTGHDHLAVLSYGLWQRRFGGDPKVLGQMITLNGEAFQVIGVMPQSFRFAPFWATKAELWVPLSLDQKQTNRSASSLRVFGRLKAGVSLEQARAEMATITARLDQEFPGTNRDVKVLPLKEKVVGDVRPALLLMLGAVGFVLLISCANVAHMLLARAAARKKEIAVRIALGARRARLVRQFLTESVLLSSMAGAAGLAIGLWGIKVLVKLQPARFSNVTEVNVDGSVLAFTLAVSVLTGIVFGLAPAIHGSSMNLSDSLKESERGSTEGLRRNRLRSVLVASEFALALMLLVGAGLMIRSIVALNEVDPGFNPDRTLTMVVSVAGTQEFEPSRRMPFYQEVVQRIQSMGGVRSVSAINHIPLAGDLWGIPYLVEGRPVPKRGEVPGAVYRVVLPGYFETMQIPLLRGRDFTANDNVNAPGVVIINQTFAKQYWGEEDPVGKRVALTDTLADAKWLTVVGVIKDVKQDEWTGPVDLEFYIPCLQDKTYIADEPFAVSSLTLVVRTWGNPNETVPAIRNAVWSIDKNVTISEVQTLEEIVSRVNAQSRFYLVLLGSFAAVALVLAGVGMYAVMSYSVAQRTHEIGIRMALGAGQSDVLKLIVQQGLVVAVLGAAFGLAGSLLATKLMLSFLYGVQPRDPLTIAAVWVVLTSVALLACYIPARRATRVDPMVALRYE